MKIESTVESGRGRRLIGVFLITFLFFALPAMRVSATPIGADAVVLVNSQSANYPDFQHFIQPYLDNFGVPYTVQDISATSVDSTIGTHSLIIIGHGQIDTSHTYLTTAAQNAITSAVNAGTGLVNFDGALSAGQYSFVQSIFGFTYGSNKSGSGINFPATEAGSKMHYITSLHPVNDSLALSNNISMAGVTFGSSVTGVVMSSSSPLVMITKYGQGRAVQFASYDWIKVAYLGPVNGMDDVVWRSLVWSARKPFVLRGMPNFATMRVDDVAGPFTWAHTANQAGFKPYLAIFYGSIANNDATDLSGLATSGKVTTSVHAITDTQFLYFNHQAGTPYTDSQVNSYFAAATQWHQAHNIPISKMMIPHWSEIGANAFAGLKAWGIEYVLIEVQPGTREYYSPYPAWIPLGPYRLYDTQLQGQSLNPMVYADFLPIPGHPEFDGAFFDPYTEIRNVTPSPAYTILDGGDWAPSTDVSGSVYRGTQQIKRGMDSMTMGNTFTHEKYISAIPNATWLSILQGIVTNLAPYNPQYVTMDYANQYVRATRTAKLTGSTYDPNSGVVTATLTGKTDLTLNYYVYLGADSSISNVVGTVPAFTNSATSTVTTPVSPTAPGIVSQPSSQTVPAGNDVSFTVSASGTSPFTYQWQRNNANLSNGGNILGATNATLILTAAQTNDAADYRVIVGNSVGSVTSSVAILTVNPPQIAPGITTQPDSQTVATGTNVTFNVEVSGTSPFTYQWQRDNANLSNNSKYSGVTTAALTLTGTQTNDSANYRVIVANSVGSVTSSVAVLTVNPPPTPPGIISQPSDQTVAYGSDVNFTVAVSGMSPFTYQWQLNNANLTDGGTVSGSTTATLSLTGAETDDSANYRVIIANSGGSVTSSVAVLTVNPLPAPRITSIVRKANGNMDLTIASQTGYNCQLQFSSNSVTWIPLVTLTSTNGTVTYTDTNANTSPLRFYRAMMLD